MADALQMTKHNKWNQFEQKSIYIPIIFIG